MHERGELICGWRGGHSQGKATERSKHPRPPTLVKFVEATPSGFLGPTMSTSDTSDTSEECGRPQCRLSLSLSECVVHPVLVPRLALRCMRAVRGLRTCGVVAYGPSVSRACRERAVPGAALGVDIKKCTPYFKCGALLVFTPHVWR